MPYTPQDITVLITCYKEGELLRRAFDSLQRQTVQGFQVILVNDCSPDPLTNQICEELAEIDNVTYLKLDTNGGSSVARNAGLAIAKCSLLVPLDGDDSIPPDLLSIVLESFNHNPEISFLFGDYNLCIPETGAEKVVDCGFLADESGRLNPYELAKKWELLGQIPYKIELWEKLGGYKVEFSRTFEDVVFWREAIMAGFSGLYIPKPIYNWFRSEKGKNASLSEDEFFPVRVHSLPFYDRFNPEYGKEMRRYIYRYYAQRLMHKELAEFVRRESDSFSLVQILKAKLMNFPVLYKAGRKIKNLFK